MESTKQMPGFTAPAKMYRIGEVVEYTTFSRQTIHNYTIMGLIQESRWTQGGHRLYEESVFERLSRIGELRQTKTLAEIRDILSKEDSESKSLVQCGSDINRAGHN